MAKRRIVKQSDISPIMVPANIGGPALEVARNRTRDILDWIGTFHYRLDDLLAQAYMIGAVDGYDLAIKKKENA